MSWSTFLKQEFEQNYFRSISSFLSKEYEMHTIFPPKNEIFNAFNYCPFENVKVVVLGADPYHDKQQAMGLSFSVKPGIKIPPSLQNIFKEIKNDLNIDQPKHGCLVSWAKQGILLLNSALTVREHEPSSHIKIWEPFTDNIMRMLNDAKQPIVFLLWGAFARKKGTLITNKHHLKLEAVHPSPLSAYNGFFGCKHFSKTNEFLVQNNFTPINWQLENL